MLKEGELGKTINRIPESGSGTFPFVVEAAKKEEEVLVKEIVNVPERKDKQGKKRAILRMGSEGEDVRAMQVSLFLYFIYLLQKIKQTAISMSYWVKTCNVDADVCWRQFKLGTLRGLILEPFLTEFFHLRLML